MNRLAELRPRLAVFGVLAALVVAVPVCLILAHEEAIRRGEVFRFRTAPVDPYDAFRGRYVALGFPPAEATVAAYTKLTPGQKVFVTLGRDDEGFARLDAVSPERPSSPSYLRLAVSRISGSRVFFELPFDRFYMNERLAPEAERVYRHTSWERRDETWVEVRVYRGRAVVEELFVGGRPIADLLESSSR